MKLKTVGKQVKKKKEKKEEQVIVDNTIFELPIHYGKPFPFATSFENLINTLPLVAKNILKNGKVKSIKANSSEMIVNYEVNNEKLKMIVEDTVLGGISCKILTVKNKKEIILKSDFIRNSIYLNSN